MVARVRGWLVGCLRAWFCWFVGLLACVLLFVSSVPRDTPDTSVAHLNQPNIQPIKLTEFETKQSKYKMLGKLPTRAMLVGPLGSRKGVLLSNTILDIYRDCFSRIYIFSPSIHVDYTWKPVEDDIEKEMEVRHTEEKPT